MKAPTNHAHLLPHFVELRSRINRRLEELKTRHRRLQIDSYPWLYGALGGVPSDVVFICENPSRRGVHQAHVETIDGGPPDIEAQWWGGPDDKAATIFRVVLHRLGFKRSPPAARAGWNCYITNVVKEANFGFEQKDLSSSERLSQARDWASVLSWELEQVKPRKVFVVGRPAEKAVKHLVRQGLIPPLAPQYVWHYSAHRSAEHVMAMMEEGIAKGLGT